MKTRLFFVLTFLLAIVGCDKIKDAATITINTQLKADIPVSITALGVKSDMIGVNAPISFSKTYDLNLDGNVDIAPYLAKIKSINLNELVITVTGLSTGQTINSVSLDVSGIGNIMTVTNISMTNNTFTPTLVAGILDQIAAKLIADRKITFTVSGNVSGPMSFTVGLNFDTRVVAFLLN